MNRKHSRILRTRGCRSQRGGWSLVELLVAVAVMTATTTLIAQLLSSSRNHWSSVSSQQQALFAADAVVRQLSLLPFDELTDSSPVIEELRQEVALKLPQANLQVTVTPSEQGAISSKHIVAEISWPVATEPQPRSVQLESWIYAEPAATETELPEPAEPAPEESADTAATTEEPAERSTAESAASAEETTPDEAAVESSPQPEEQRR